MFVKTKKPEELAKEIFWLAWQACGNPQGMGFLQDNPWATKDAVWDNVANEGDYCGNFRSSAKSPYADYVFGRMMKFGLDINKDGVDIPECSVSMDYQAWCWKYKTVEDLVKAAQESLDGV